MTTASNVATPSSAPPSKTAAAEKRQAGEMDLAHGQIVIVLARWILVSAGLVFSLWNPGPVGQMRIQIIVILLLAFANFYLHTRILMKKPVISGAAYGASLGDIIVITLIIITSGGYSSNAFPFYFPAILAFSVAFPGWFTLLMTGGIVTVYGFTGLISLAVMRGETAADYQALVAQLIMLCAVAFCGHIYRRIEASRRQEAEKGHAMLIAELEAERGASSTPARGAGR